MRIHLGRDRFITITEEDQQGFTAKYNAAIKAEETVMNYNGYVIPIETGKAAVNDMERVFGVNNAPEGYLSKD